MTTATLQPVQPEAHFATKEDLAKAEGRLNEKITAAEGRLNEKITAAEGRLNEKIAELRADLERSLRHMTWQLTGTVIAVAVVIVTILRFWPPGPGG